MKHLDFNNALDAIEIGLTKYNKIISKVYDSPIKVFEKWRNKYYANEQKIFLGIKILKDVPLENLTEFILENVPPLISKKRSVVIDSGHYLGNAEYNGGNLLPPDETSRMTFYGGVRLYGVLNKTGVSNLCFGYLVNDLTYGGEDTEMRNILKDANHPFPEEYERILYEELGKNNQYLLRPHEYRLMKNNGFLKELDFDKGLIILVDYESTLKNGAIRTLKRMSENNLLLKSGDIYMLNPRETRSSIKLALVKEKPEISQLFRLLEKDAGIFREGACDMTPECRALQLQSLIEKNNLGFDTVVNIFNEPMYKCHGLFADAYSRISKPQEAMNIINVYVRNIENRVTVAMTSYLVDTLCPELFLKS